jgi:beta-lactam-binding protein with PASTA domain
VPRVIGLRLATAKTKIRHANCSVGTVKRAHSRVAAGRVVRQSPKAHRHLGARARVNLVVSSGRR